MPNFKKFANGGIENGNSSEFSSVRHRQVRDTKVGFRIERVWSADFEKCESREDYEKYISKYGKYDANKYVEQARARIESLDAAENARIEREKEARKAQHQTVVPGSGGSGMSTQKKFIQTLMNAAIWIVIIGGVGLYSYNQYRHEEKKKTTDVVINTQPSQPQQDEEYTTQTHPERTHEHESQVVEPEPVHQEVWCDCNICGTTGRCQICFGTRRCGVCGGGGSLYRYSGWIDCEYCGGSGRCPSCEGSGACFACHGLGKFKLEENF